MDRNKLEKYIKEGSYLKICHFFDSLSRWCKSAFIGALFAKSPVQHQSMAVDRLSSWIANCKENEQPGHFNLSIPKL
jgi:hypothetical protein